MDTSTLEGIAKQFEHGELGSRILFYEEIDSTNRKALNLAEEDAFHGLVLAAHSQTLGRGRQGRSWFCAPGKGLFVTCLLIDDGIKEHIPLVGFTAALAIFDALSSYSDQLDIKWPNDVLLDGKKISGILGEMSTTAEGITRIALGLSVNISHLPEDFPDELKESATSMRIAGGLSPGPEELLHKILVSLNKWYKMLVEGRSSEIITAIARRSSYASGRRMRVKIDAQTEVVGTSTGLNEDGSLQLRLDTGIEIALNAGDVHLL